MVLAINSSVYSGMPYFSAYFSNNGLYRSTASLTWAVPSADTWMLFNVSWLSVPDMVLTIIIGINKRTANKAIKNMKPAMPMPVIHFHISNHPLYKESPLDGGLLLIILIFHQFWSGILFFFNGFSIGIIVLFPRFIVFD